MSGWEAEIKAGVVGSEAVGDSNMKDGRETLGGSKDQRDLRTMVAIWVGEIN